MKKAPIEYILLKKAVRDCSQAIVTPFDLSKNKGVLGTFAVLGAINSTFNPFYRIGVHLRKTWKSYYGRPMRYRRMF